MNVTRAARTMSLGWILTIAVAVTASGHWLIDEAPGQVIPALVEFIN